MENLFILKAACLLHDPPTKAWDLVERINHEEKAMEIAEKILRNCKLYEAKEYLIGINSDYVKQSDHLAASVDRWLLSKLVGKSYSSFSVNEIKMKNIFNPKFSIKIDGKLDDRQVDEFAKRLNLILKDIQDVDLVYHVLYACYEATWISCNLPAGPADTRVPSHSVFDHNYATASMMNWLIKSKSPKGILLFIDLGGPQKFISNSRKLRDLWISSYLASALAWRLFWILIRRLGPDVMILPTCRGNPFYYHSLISELYQKNIDEKIINEIKKLAKEVVENYDPDEDVIPRYAVIPVTATFILPDIDVLKQFSDFRNIESLEDLKKLVENEYSRIWKDMYETIVENCSQLKNDLGKLAEKSKELLEKCRNYGFDQTPPFPIRVVAIHTDELYKIGFPTSEEEQYSLYHYMFKLLAYKESREKIYRFRPEENLKLYDMTSNPIESWKESKRGFDYCSLCGYLPAIIIMPSNEEEFKSESLDLRIEPIFSFGERLCPYCLIKRLLSISGILKPVMDKLLGKVSNKELHYIRFLSVTDIALIPFKFSIVNAVRRIDEAPDNVKDWFSKLVMKLFNEISSISGMRFDDLTRTREEAILHKEKKLLSMINKMKTDKLKGLLECLILLDSENGILGKSELRRVWKSFLENLRNGEGRHYVDFKMIHPINTYYAVVRCDADNFGKIIRGEIEEGFRVKIDHYLTDILEDEARDVVKALINGKYSEAKKLCEKEGISNIDGRLKELKEAIDRLIGRKEIIVSPSYHSALSRALISNAFRDIKNVERYGGLVVYAGGDDLLFVMPVSNCLNAVKDLKTDFSFPLLDLKGFHKVRKYYIPSLVTASRSFCIYLSHYMYPMYAIMNRSMKLLEETAKETKWMLDGVEEREKDALVFSYSSRGKEMTALLPLSDIRNPEENLGVSLKYVDDLINSIEMDSKFSASLIYDLNSCELIEPLIKQGNSLLLGKVIKNIFYRNCEIKDRDLRLRKAEENARNIMENYDLKFKVNNELRFYLKELVLSLKLYRSGLREAA